LTVPGYGALRDWTHELLRDPVREYPLFEAGLCLLPVVPPSEALALLRDRALRLTGMATQLEAQLAEILGQDLATFAGTQGLPEELAFGGLAGQNSRRCSSSKRSSASR
jgi:hypothetical protein